MIRPSASPERGFTLAELSVTMAITLLVGMMIFLILNAGMTLYAKNTAVNSAHQQARAGVDQMLANLHGSVSIPQLTDASLNAASELDAAGSPIPRQGISFQTFNAGPFPVVVDAAATDKSVTLYCPGYTPPTNARLNIPTHGIEYDISSTAVSGSNLKYNLTTPNNAGIGTAIDISGNGLEADPANKYVIAAFITTRLSYAVNGNELRYYPTNNINSYKVITRNIISPTPFTIPILASGGLQNRFVAAVNLSTVEPQFTKRGYAAVNMFISSLIPFRCRLTNSQ
jgi:hypothetical protein